VTRLRSSHTVRRVFRTGVLCFALFAPSAFAADAATPEPVVAPAPIVAQPAVIPEPEIPKSEPPFDSDEEMSVGWTLLRTMAALAIVVALAWLLLNVGLRRLMGIKPVMGMPVVSVIERVPLDQKRALFVVEAAGEVLLIGGGEGSLSLLAKLDRSEIDKLRKVQNAPVQLSPFLQKLLGRKEPASTPDQPSQSVAASSDGASPVKETK
jgi:flagellar protein FliO/FliZ